MALRPVPERKPVTAPSRASRGLPRNKVVRYGHKVATRVCERIAGGESWFRICNSDGLPSYTTLYAWAAKYPEFGRALAEARQMAADLRADKALAVAEASTAATASADRLHVSALQWHAGKSAPGRWGAKADDGWSDGAGGRRLVVEVRQFERAWDEAGKPFVREVLPDGAAGGRGRARLVRGAAVVLPDPDEGEGA